MQSAVDFIRHRFIKPILGFLKQGTSPHKLAISISLGFILGLFPVLGVTTFIGFALSFIFKLNAAALQLVNYLMYPIQIALIIPLIKIGLWLFGDDTITFTIGELINRMREDFYNTIAELWQIYVLGVFSWVVFIAPLGILVFVISKNILKRMKTGLGTSSDANSVD